jgi:hypothetical protein
MMRGGRGGGVRLKLYLSIIWIASKSPYDTSFPARGWAELLALPDPEVKGARRITEALEWLHNRGLVRRYRQPGRPSNVILRDDAGRKVEYRPPYSAGEAYIKIPSALWTSGWITILSGTALALLLILLDQQDLDEPNRAVWLSPRKARQMYSLSPATWVKGTSELRRYGLVTGRRAAVNKDFFGWKRVRNTYVVRPSRLESPPGEVEESPP